MPDNISRLIPFSLFFLSSSLLLIIIIITKTLSLPTTSYKYYFFTLLSLFLLHPIPLVAPSTERLRPPILSSFAQLVVLVFALPLLRLPLVRLFSSLAGFNC